MTGAYSGVAGQRCRGFLRAAQLALKRESSGAEAENAGIAPISIGLGLRAYLGWYTKDNMVFMSLSACRPVKSSWFSCRSDIIFMTPHETSS